MTTLGWVFLTLSTGFVWTLCGWCYYKVLTAPEPPAEEVKEFHSA